MMSADASYAVATPLGSMSDDRSMRTSSRRTILAGSIGNAVEFVDWNIYATFSPFFSDQFFPSRDKTAALLSALAVFAAGFIMRPIGGAVLGSIADRRGRMTGLTLSVSLMAGASLIIAVCPAYTSIGVFAPAILLFARLVQGFSNGGEFGASSAYLVEMAPPGRRAFFGSWQQVTVSASHLVVAGLATALAYVLPETAMHAWGWRAAFGFGATLGLVGFWLRSSVGESRMFERDDRRVPARRSPLVAMLTNHRAAAFRVIGITIAGTMTYYIWISYMPTYAHVATGLPLPSALLGNTIAVALFTVLLPFGGILSDRVGRRSTLMMFAGGFALIAWPALHAMRNSFPTFMAIELAGVILLVGYSANCAVIMAEQFPTDVRTVGIALPYALATALFGGTAPYIVTWLVVHHAVGWTSSYVIAASVASFLVYFAMPETSRKELE
jgi:MHS family alpha-ketoglutarate permease-like MFS transporter